MAKKKVLDMLKQEIEVGARVIYLRSTINGYTPVKAIVQHVKIRARTEDDARVYDSPPIIQVTVDCGKIRGIVKVRDPEKLIVVDKLGLSKWKLG